MTNFFISAGLAETPTRENRALVAVSRNSKKVAMLTAPVPATEIFPQFTLRFEGVVWSVVPAVIVKT